MATKLMSLAGGQFGKRELRAAVKEQDLNLKDSQISYEMKEELPESPMDAVDSADEFPRDILARINEFRFIDDTFARRAFKGHPKLAEFVLSTITKIDDIIIDEKEYETQYDAISLTESRSFVLDVHAGDEKGRKYDFELEKNDATPKRMEVHVGAMIAEHMRKGGQFEDLPELYVIFVYENDPVGNGRAVNEFCYRNSDKFLEDNEGQDMPGPHESMGGSTHILTVNGAYRNESSGIGMLIHDLMCAKPEEMHYSMLADRMKEIKHNPEEVRYMCKVLNDVRAEGKAEGKAEGSNQRLIQDIKNVMESFGVSIEKAMDSLKVPQGERAAIVGMVNAVEANNPV